jgi:hypothetical protein
MRAAWLVVMVMLVVMNASADSQRVKAEFDRFSDTTSVILSPRSGQMASWAPEISIFSSFKGTKIRATPSTIVSLTLWSTSETWSFIRCHSVGILIDGKPPKEKLRPRWDGTTSGIGVIEHVAARVSLSTITSMAAAKKVEMKLCNVEWALDQDDMEALRAFVLILNPKARLPRVIVVDAGSAIEPPTAALGGKAEETTTEEPLYAWPAPEKTDAGSPLQQCLARGLSDEQCGDLLE